MHFSLIVSCRRHALQRDFGRNNYLKTQNKRQQEYVKYQNKMANTYSKGDLVGITINKVDRTNCDAKLLPCIIDERIDHGTVPNYRLICPFGRLATLFPVHQIFRLSSPKPDSLVHIDATNIPTVSFVNACKMFARTSVSATCDCKTKCLTKTCPCRRTSVPCSSKCHARRGKCSNAD